MAQRRSSNEKPRSTVSTKRKSVVCSSSVLALEALESTSQPLIQPSSTTVIGTRREIVRLRTDVIVSDRRRMFSYSDLSVGIQVRLLPCFVVFNLLFVPWSLSLSLSLYLHILRSLTHTLALPLSLSLSLFLSPLFDATQLKKICSRERYLRSSWRSS